MQWQSIHVKNVTSFESQRNRIDGRNSGAEKMSQIVVSNSMAMISCPSSERLDPKPKSDAAIAMSAREALRSLERSSLDRITCEYHEEMLILKGTVNAFFLKRLPQETVRRICDIRAVHNIIEVKESAEVIDTVDANTAHGVR